MQGLADGYFVAPYTVGDYLANEIRTGNIDIHAPEFDAAEEEVTQRINHFLNNNGKTSVDNFHRRLGKIMWDKCGMARNAQGLQEAINEIKALREEFWKDVKVPGRADMYNPELDKAGRVADFLELGELMCLDALTREESCGGHFREEHQTEEGEALRNDADFAFVSAWEYVGEPADAKLHKEELVFENIKLVTRSYK
jgi:succinate dehydrogenase / fumarate reductase flavoprotein subunit